MHICVPTVTYTMHLIGTGCYRLFPKWVEEASYARLTSAKVASFIRSHIICRHGVPHELISDRGSHCRAGVDTLLQRYGVQHHRSSAYRPQTNGAVEAANKNIKRILCKMIEYKNFKNFLVYDFIYGIFILRLL